MISAKGQDNRFAVVGDFQVQEFMDDDVLAERCRLGQQVETERNRDGVKGSVAQIFHTVRRDILRNTSDGATLEKPKPATSF